MISIVTVVYNGEKTIRHTLESVCSQSLQPYEYIIVDGLSTDNTVNIIKEYMKQYPFIKLISEKDSGIYDAMNKGVRMASGSLIGIINSDDWYEKHALERMQEAYALHGTGIYYGIQRNLLQDKEYYLERSNQEFLAQKMIPHPSTFVTADIYKVHGLFDTQYKYAADLELFVRYLRANVPFYHLDHIIANFRIGGASSTPVAVKEALGIRKRYGMISNRQYNFKVLKMKVKSLLNYS